MRITSAIFPLMTGHFPVVDRLLSDIMESLAESCIDSVAIFLVSRFDLDPLLNVLLAQLRIFSEAASIDCRPGR